MLRMMKEGFAGKIRVKGRLCEFEDMPPSELVSKGLSGYSQRYNNTLGRENSRHRQGICGETKTEPTEA